MKFTNNANAVLDLDPSLESGTFGMEVNAKAFSVLTDSIYRDKVKAVIRELACNAQDSHTEAGQTRPIEVHLPMQDEEYFYVKDYGVGLSKADILTVYTKFFASTKDKTNKFIGSLGIGAKSFYAYYSRTCVITSDHDGTRLIYKCYLGENGVPTHTKLFEGPTEEPNGVKVEFPCKRGDFNSFEEKAKEVFKWFDQKPKFIGKQITIPTIKRDIEGNKWFLNHNLNDTYVLMGNIGYVVESGDAELAKYEELMRCGLVLEAKLGEVEFESAREGLSYTPKTVAFLKKRLRSVADELATELEGKIVNATNFYNACNEYSIHWSNMNYSIKRIVQASGVPSKWKTKNIVSSVNMVCEGVDTCTYSIRSTMRARKMPWANTLTYGKVQLVEVDMKVGQHVRAKFYCEENLTDVILVSFDEEKFPDCRKNFCDKIGCDKSDFILASSITVPKVVRANNRTTLTNLMEYTKSYKESTAWQDVSLDIEEETGIYVVRHAYKFIDYANSEEHAPPSKIDDYTRFLGITTPIYGIRKKDLEKFKEAGWTSLCDKFIEELSKKEGKVVDRIVSAKTEKINNYTIGTTIDNMSRAGVCLDLVNEIKKFDQANNTSWNHDPYWIINIVAKRNEDVINQRVKENNKKGQELVRQVHEVEKKYPLIKLNVPHSLVPELKFYIEGVDKNVSSKNANQQFSNSNHQRTAVHSW